MKTNKEKEIFKEKQRKLSFYKKALIKKATEGEKIFIEKCQYYGINYVFQKGFIAGNGFCIADFYLPQYRLVVEIDGKYHDTPKQRTRDHFKDEYYKKRRLNILRIKEEDVESFSFTYFWNIYDYSKPCPPNPIKRAKIERKKHYDLLRKKYAEFL